MNNDFADVHRDNRQHHPQQELASQLLCVIVDEIVGIQRDRQQVMGGGPGYQEQELRKLLFNIVAPAEETPPVHQQNQANSERPDQASFAELFHEERAQHPR